MMRVNDVGYQEKLQAEAVYIEKVVAGHHSLFVRPQVSCTGDLSYDAYDVAVQRGVMSACQGINVDELRRYP